MQERVGMVAGADMSCGLGGDLVARRHGEEEEELFDDTGSCASGGESDDDGDRFPDSGAEEADGAVQDDRRRFAPPQPLRRMNSDSIYDMSGMTAQLPAKKGLSAYYAGKSQSFACMSDVRCLEDLRKKEKPRRSQKIKPCKSYVALGGMAKNPASASSCANLSMMAASGFMAPPVHINKNSYNQ